MNYYYYLSGTDWLIYMGEHPRSLQDTVGPFYCFSDCKASLLKGLRLRKKEIMDEIFRAENITQKKVRQEFYEEDL